MQLFHKNYYNKPILEAKYLDIVYLENSGNIKN